MDLFYWFIFQLGRFVNGYGKVLYVKSGSLDLGAIEQFKFSNNTLFPQGKWVPPHHHWSQQHNIHIYSFISLFLGAKAIGV